MLTPREVESNFKWRVPHYEPNSAGNLFLLSVFYVKYNQRNRLKNVILSFQWSIYHGYHYTPQERLLATESTEKKKLIAFS